MPRKSAASMAIAPLVDIGHFPAPPADLSEFQASIWTSVVATKPSDWFTADSLPLLLSYCKMVSQAAVLDQQLDEFEPEWMKEAAGLLRYKELTKLRVLVTGKMESLARSMRLTQQSRYDKRVAANQSDKTGSKSDRQPWAH